MPKYYKILDNGVSPMASKKSGYNQSGGKKNDPNRAKFVDKYVKQNTKSADRPATKKQARNAYYLTSVDDKKGTRGAKSTGAKTKTPAGSMMRTRADGTSAGRSTRNPSTTRDVDTRRKEGMGVRGRLKGERVVWGGKLNPTSPVGIGRGGAKREGLGSTRNPAGSMKEKRVAGPSTRAKTSSKAPRSAPKATGRRDKNRRTY